MHKARATRVEQTLRALGVQVVRARVAAAKGEGGNRSLVQRLVAHAALGVLLDGIAHHLSDDALQLVVRRASNQRRHCDSYIHHGHSG